MEAFMKRIELSIETKHSKAEQDLKKMLEDFDTKKFYEKLSRKAETVQIRDLRQTQNEI